MNDGAEVPSEHKFVVPKSGGQSRQPTGTQRPHILPPMPEPEATTSSQTVKRSYRAFSRTGEVRANVAYDRDLSLDTFLGKAANYPLDGALEQFFKQHFQAKTAIVWQEITGLQILFSQSVNSQTPHSSGLVGYSFFSRSVIRCASGPGHPSYHAASDEKFCPFNAPLMIFPLWDWKNNLVMVVEVIRNIQAPEFTQDDESYVSWFQKKFKMLSRWLRPTIETEPLAVDLLQTMGSEQFFKEAMPKLREFFGVLRFEIWKYDKETKDMYRYTRRKEIIDPSNAGIAGDSLTREQTVNCINCRLHSNYSHDVDGREAAVLSVPVLERDGQFVYALVLRGPKKGTVFVKDDEEVVKRVAPIVLLSLSNMEAFSKRERDYNESKMERESLAALLEVVEILSSQLDTEKLVDVIMEKGRALTDADRCSLFLVNDTRDRLITSLHQGLANAIDIPISKGIAGKTVTEGKILNIPDAYETDFFDSSTDLETGYRTKSILSVPIYNNRGEVIGVTEMVNKLNEQPFSLWDTKVIQIFNVFCGISLENARLFKESIEMSNQIRSFFDVSFAISRTENTQRMLMDIMHNAKKLINADAGTIFLVDETKGILSTYVSDEKHMPPTIVMNIGVAAQCVKSKEGSIVNDAYGSATFNRTLDNMTGYKTNSLLVAPIIGASGSVIGVVEMLNKVNGIFDKKDLRLLTIFAQLASIALENSKLRDSANLRDEDIELNNWITEEERSTFECPKNLVLTEEQQKQQLQLNCFSLDFKGINHFKALFFLFNRFNLLETFKVTNEQFFRFVFTISSTYNDVPYHNWLHACDVTQYVSYECVTAGADKIFTADEMFGLLTAAVCHDANHEGFNNIFNVKAETPFGILYKNQSVMEMHHITVAIPILTRDEINMFHSLPPDRVKKMWNLIISLILATDMAHHFELVKKATAFLDEGTWDISVPEHRQLALQLILKVADISNVSRPFEIADKWCDILCNEFFRQGDLEKETGIGLTSPLNDREHSDKPKSQIGFYNFICLPLYQVIARIFPPLQVNADSVKANLETWKSLAAAAAPQET